MTGLLTNAEPLLVNYVDTWRLRPDAVTSIRNFFLASDYVRTYTDIATMEAANEAARRAVNGVLAASSSDAPVCQIWNLHEPEVLAPLRAYDRERFERGLPWDDRVSLVGDRLTTLLGSRDLGTLLPGAQSDSVSVPGLAGNATSNPIQFLPR